MTQISRRGICSDCHVFKRLYGQTQCRTCYQARRKIILKAHGIQIPKRLGIRPNHWKFEVVEL